MNGLQRGFAAYYRWPIGRDQSWHCGPTGNTREAVSIAVGDAWGDCEIKPIVRIDRLPRRLNRAPPANFSLCSIDDQMSRLVAPFGRRFFHWWAGKPERTEMRA